MNKNKIRLMIAGFVFSASWAATVQAQPPDVQCNGNREPVSRGQAQREFDVPQSDFDEEDNDGDNWICCKIVGNELTQCQDDRFD